MRNVPAEPTERKLARAADHPPRCVREVQLVGKSLTVVADMERVDLIDGPVTERWLYRAGRWTSRRLSGASR